MRNYNTIKNTTNNLERRSVLLPLIWILTALLCIVLIVGVTDLGILANFEQPFITVSRRTQYHQEETDPTQTAAAVTPAKSNGITVAIDPGHGYADPGADYKYIGDLSEKDINLFVATYLADELRLLGYEVIMTRDSDIPPEGESSDHYLFNPQARVKVVNSTDADFCLSIHCDYFAQDESVFGPRIYYFVEEKDFAKHLSQNMGDSIYDEMGARKTVLVEMSGANAYHILRNTKIPTILIELGFITNQTEAEKMITEEWQKNIAAAIAKGVDNADIASFKD